MVLEHRHRTDGSFRIRQLIVPTTDQIVEDRKRAGHQEIQNQFGLHVKVPADTPATDVISIQFNHLMDRTNPMWPAGNNECTISCNARSNYSPHQLPLL